MMPFSYLFSDWAGGMLTTHEYQGIEYSAEADVPDRHEQH